MRPGHIHHNHAHDNHPYAHKLHRRHGLPEQGDSDGNDHDRAHARPDGVDDAHVELLQNRSEQHERAHVPEHHDDARQDSSESLGRFQVEGGDAFERDCSREPHPHHGDNPRSLQLIPD